MSYSLMFVMVIHGILVLSVMKSRWHWPILLGIFSFMQLEAQERMLSETYYYHLGIEPYIYFICGALCIVGFIHWCKSKQPIKIKSASWKIIFLTWILIGIFMAGMTYYVSEYIPNSEPLVLSIFGYSALIASVILLVNKNIESCILLFGANIAFMLEPSVVHGYQNPNALYNIAWIIISILVTITWYNELLRDELLNNTKNGGDNMDNKENLYVLTEQGDLGLGANQITDEEQRKVDEAQARQQRQSK